MESLDATYATEEEAGICELVYKRASVKLAFNHQSAPSSSFQIVKPNRDNDSLFPPISRATLKELDDQFLQSNVQILHDLLLEPNLKIKPNAERRCSLDQRTKTEGYWKLIKSEIDAIFECHRQGKLAVVSQRLLLMIQEIKEILIDLYPQSRVLIHDAQEFLDPEMIIQQLIYGAFDPTSFAQVLRDVMKANCAPRRDPLVDQLVDFSKEGKIVEMLRLCFELLELMKLDLANYRLAKCRPDFANSFVEKERLFFANQNSDYSQTVAWLRSIEENCELKYETFVKGFLKIMSLPSSIPETFLLDSARIANLQREYQDVCVIATILILFRQWAGTRISKRDISEAKARFTRILGKSTAVVQDLADQLVLMVCHCQKRAISGQKRKALEGLVDQVIDPSNQVFRMVETRIEEFLKTRLTDSCCSEPSQPGLVDCVEELNRLYRKMSALVLVNWKVHEPKYHSILNNRKQ